MNVKLENLIFGLLGGATSDLLIDFPLDYVGAFKTWDFLDANGIWIWGISTSEIINLLAGVAMVLFGGKKHKAIQEAGIGWLLSIGIIKLSELYSYLRYLWNQYAGGTVALTSQANPTLTQQVTASGESVTSYPRTSYVLGNSGSVSEITSLPENSGRGEAVQPTWRIWEGHYGSIKTVPTGTFNGVSSGLSLPEMEHITPEIEATLAAIGSHRTWETGGLQPTGTFG